MLSAGPLASPQLLELSGIGNSEILKQHGVGVVHHLPGVGQNLQDHYATILSHERKEPGPFRHFTRAARLLLGMSGPCAALISQWSLRNIQALAEAHAEWLKPRWPARIAVWRELLQAAVTGDEGALERARLHGLTLLAAEVRGSESARPAAGAVGAAWPIISR